MAAKTQAKPAAKQQPSKPTSQVPAVQQPPGKAGIIMADPNQVPEHLKAVMGDNRGSENVQSEDLVIPRLEIVQALSPQVEEGHAKFIRGAKQGDLYNSASNQLYGKEVFIVPVYFEKLFLVWVDRKMGGGFRGQFKDMVDAQAKADADGGEDKGLMVMDTPTHLCLIANPDSGGADEIMMAMPRTKAKISRQWNSMIRLAGGPRFSRVYRVTTNKETNAQNQTYFNFAIAPCGFPNPALFKQAEKLYEIVKSGSGRTLDTRDLDTSGGGSDPGEGSEM